MQCPAAGTSQSPDVNGNGLRHLLDAGALHLMDAAVQPLTPAPLLVVEDVRCAFDLISIFNFYLPRNKLFRSWKRLT